MRFRRCRAPRQDDPAACQARAARPALRSAGSARGVRFRLWTLVVAALLLLVGPHRSDAGALSDDGRVGTVTDLQGTVLVRPAGHRRWSPVGPRTVLLPGDDLRTMPRGANAVEVRFAGGGHLVLGPGGLVTLEARGKLRLLDGDAEVAGAAGREVAVTGPGGFAAQVGGSAAVVRVDDAGRAATKLAEPPRWLTGWRASTTDEWMGSLVAQVDGRDVPLTVGYHKVSVTIRDQIAETTVEESFVNSTDSVLEGVFTFPLPAGASISGFGMWVGDELVEADIVEKQRARAIYEDIKSRRKDPGLLEWSGGNLFQANVFPINPHGEKRVRLRYTQVLPLEGRTVRYRYALRSELLRTHPLRRLQIHVDLQSAARLASASSPTHEVKVTQTEHEATLDYDAGEVTPDRDFEAAFTLADASPLRVATHRRGDDGYLLLLFAPPDPSADGWKRDLVPEGAPLDLVFVADTSGSMGPAERAAQRAFLASSLALLGPEDRFRLMAFDAQVEWLVPDALAATPENAAKALDLLDHRMSLGWTDLDQAFGSVVSKLSAAKASAGALVVYLGDGIGTTGDADPVALAQRIARVQAPAGASFHAVSTGTSYEEGVLAAIAAHGGGSVRAAGDDPAQSAFALLSEVAQPAVKDVAIAFTGVRTARVYPSKLANLPAGTQQVVLGRFLPEGNGPQRGEVTVTGTLSGKPVSYSAEVVVPEGDAARPDDNSFLPRLWARLHVDALLAEGRTPEIRDQVVSVSERYGIMTPYTSLLVLENDEDRERYGVTRRVAMRDGERFFTAARTAAQTAALREGMREAQAWRVGLRRRMLAEVMDLGRSLPLGGGYGDGVAISIGGGAGGPFGARPSSGAYRGPQGEMAPWGGDRKLGSAKKSLRDTGVDFDGGDGAKDESDFDTETSSEVPPDSREPSDPPPAPEFDGPGTPGGEEMGFAEAAKAPAPAREAFSRLEAAGDDGNFGGGSPPPASGPRAGYAGHRKVSFESGQPWIGRQLLQFFPGLAGPSPAEPPLPDTPLWDADARTLLVAVSEPPRLAPDATTRLDVTSKSGSSPDLDPGWWPTAVQRTLVAPDRWFTRALSLNQEPVDQWLAPGDAPDAASGRGVLLTGKRLGRRRAAADADRAAWAAAGGLLRTDYRRSYAAWTAKVVSRDGAQAIVRLTPPNQGKTSILLTIDTERQVVLEQRSLDGENTTWTYRLSGWVQVGGIWWPGESVTLDADGKETSRRTIDVREVPAPEFDTAFAASMAGHDDAIFLGATDPDLAAAKQAVHDGHGTFADHLAMAAAQASVQRWDDAWAAWEKARALAAGKPGADWIEATLLAVSRRGEQFAAHVRRMADLLAKDRGPAAAALAGQLFDLTGSVMQADERLVLVDVLRGAGDATVDAEVRWRDVQWRRRRAQALTQTGRQDEAIEIFRALWKERPDDLQRTQELMQALAQVRDVDGALELFRAADLGAAKKRTYQVQQLGWQLVALLWDAYRFDDMLAVATRWAEVQPDQAAPWAARLSALAALERIDERDAWIAERLGRTELPSDDDTTTWAQLEAAVGAALRHDWNGGWWGRNATDPKWVASLTTLARRLAFRSDRGANLAQQIVNDFRNRDSDAHKALLAGLRDDLGGDGVIEALAPQRLAQVLAWLSWRRVDVDAAVWRSVTDRVIARLRAAPADKDDRRTLRAAALALLDAHDEAAEAVDLLRAELAAAPAARVPEVANDLIARLVREPWTQAMEDEAFALVPKLVEPDAKDDVRRAVLATSARWLVARLSPLRVQATLGPKVEQEKLPRAELRTRQRAAREQMRAGLAARLAAEVKTADATLRPWYEIERLCLAAEAGADPKATEGEAREALLTVKGAADDALAFVLRERAVLVLTYLAARRAAPEGLADRVVALLRERLAADDAAGVKDEDAAYDWRYAIFRFLVVLDRPDDLDTALRAWIVPSQVESRWRVALAWLLAEKGKVAEAAALFEEVAGLDELSAAQYATLANWYLALGDDPRRESSLQRRWDHTDENRLQQRVYAETNRVSRPGPDGVPPSMDDDVLRAIRSLLSRSSRPQNTLWAIGALYNTTKDFRVLAALADGVIGHTPEAVYPFLGATWQQISQVHEEATCDEIRARLEERAATAKTDTDRRALALLMLQVERRAAEVLDQPGPHAARALADLKRARLGAWLPGERRLLAEFLAVLGKIPDTALAEEQLAQLRDLHAAEAAGSADRLRIAFALGRTLWGYGRADAAIDGLVAALDEFRGAQGGRLPVSVNDVADALIDWHEASAKFGAGEAWLVAETGRQTSRAQREWYERRTFLLWANCLGKGGTVALGSGETLYRAARERMEKALTAHLPDQLGEVVTSWCALHRAASKVAGVKSAGDDMVASSRGVIPQVLPRFGQNQAQQVRMVAEAMNDVAGTLPALTFLVERLEAEPVWYAVRNRWSGGWQRYGDRVAEWRAQSKLPPDLEERLLALVLKELERDLVSEEGGGRHLYGGGGHSWFWREKAEDFAKATRRVIADHAQAAGIVRFSAEYLYHGLALRDEAIEVLEAADERGVLREDGRWDLVQWHQELKHWKESLPHAERLCRDRPDNLTYRIVMIRALHYVGRDDDGRAALTAARDHFADLQARRQAGGGASAQLADLGLECEWFDLAEPLYDTALSERRRATGGRIGVNGDGETARLYGNLARVRIGLRKFDEAVDAATAAVVAWGPRDDSRSGALEALRDVLSKLPDLPAWTARWEAENAKTGTDAPVIRRALAAIHLDRKEPDAALRHLYAARRVSPDDGEIYADIVRACEMKKDGEGVATALAEWLARLPRQPDLYPRLAGSLNDLQRPDDAERALTGLAEYAPNDVEGHLRLAKVRDEAKRFDDAAVQWRQVVRIRTADVEGWYSLARSLAKAGRKDAAHAALDEFLRTPAGAERRREVERVSAEIGE